MTFGTGENISFIDSLIKFDEASWCGLNWGPWILLERSSLSALSNDPGIYRVRSMENRLAFYMGLTRRGLRGRIGDLLRNVMKDEMPFNDPHTAAPALWAYRVHDGLSFEVSAVPLSQTDQSMEALLCYILWQYRLTTGYVIMGVSIPTIPDLEIGQ